MSPRRSPEDHRLWPLQLLSGGAVQTRATSVSEGFSEAHTSRCFFIWRCRPGCLGWWGPCDTFRNIIRENSTIPRCTGGPRIRGSLWSDSFGHERWLVGRLDYRRSTVCSNLFKDTLPPARIHSQYTTTITRDCFILPTSDRYIIGLWSINTLFLSRYDLDIFLDIHTYISSFSSRYKSCTVDRNSGESCVGFDYLSKDDITLIQRSISFPIERERVYCTTT